MFNNVTGANSKGVLCHDNDSKYYIKTNEKKIIILKDIITIDAQIIKKINKLLDWGIPRGIACGIGCRRRS